MSLISIDNIYKSLDSKTILRGISYKVNKNDSLVILGGSGVGKSVLIKIMVGLLLPDTGKVNIDGVTISDLSYEERCKIILKTGFLFQDNALFDSLNIFENIVFSLKHNTRISDKELKELSIETLHLVGLLPNILALYPSDLSGGMQKRVALARTICYKPEIIFFDEPTAGLDPTISNIIHELILKVKEEIGATIITVTHDMNTARTIADSIIMLREGSIIYEGKSIDDMKTDSKDQYIRDFIM